MFDKFDKAILDDDHKVIPCDLMTWAAWYKTGVDKRRVAADAIGDVRVSTVFLGMNHAHTPVEPPLWFETMVFNGPLDGEMDRYTTWEAAAEGHAAMVERVKPAQAVPKPTDA